ncbi:1756_t:CDS:2, partial [Acaulospora morrowiae]
GAIQFFDNNIVHGRYVDESDDEFQPIRTIIQQNQKNLSLRKSVNSATQKNVKPTDERNAETSSNSPSLDMPIARPSTPEHQIYPTSANQDLLGRLNQEKQRLISSIFYNNEPICSNIIDTTNTLLMDRLKIKRDYLWVSVVNDATEYIDELIDNSDTRNKLRGKLQFPFISPDETYSFSKHYEMTWVHRFADKLW